MADLQRRRRRMGWCIGIGMVGLLGLYVYSQHGGAKFPDASTEETSNTLSAIPVISAYQSWNDIGEYATVQYQIGYSTTDSRGNEYFDQGQNYAAGFAAVVLRADVPNWRKDPIYIYKTGMTVNVTGNIQLYKGHPQIIVTSDKQMRSTP